MQDSLGRAIGIDTVTAKFRHVSFGATGNTSANDEMRSEHPYRVKLGGKGMSATDLVVPNDRTSVGVGGRSLQCHYRKYRAIQLLTGSTIKPE
jgi:hypothetical protein